MDIYSNFNSEAVERVKEIDMKLQEENSKEVADKKKITKLMFEQMLRGLYLTSF
jgi:hypothetical protein